MQVGIYVAVSVMFPDVQPVLPAFTSLLRKLSLTDVLFWCARLNYVVTSRSNLTHEQKQAFGLRWRLAVWGWTACGRWIWTSESGGFGRQ